MTAKPYILALCVLLTGCRRSVQADRIRVSFLNDDTSLADTVSLLSSNGCDQASLAAFQKAVRHYYLSPLAVDLAGFPEVKAGFYEFSTATNLVAALPLNLFDVKHDYTINCFDVVFMLAGKSLRTALDPDATGIPFVVEVNRGDNRPTPVPVGCARDAFSASYPPWYTNLVENITGVPVSDEQIAITPCLKSFCFLPRNRKTNLADTVLSVRTAQWSRLAVTFPDKFGVVLLHRLDKNKYACFTEHAGLLIKNDGSYTYVEKTGGNGPFVRIDFKKLSDLAVYFGALIHGRGNETFPHSFLTVNDKEILEVKLQQPGRLVRK